MSYAIKSLEIFKKQIRKENLKSKKIIYEKIQLIKQNPYRFKKIRSKKFSRVFRIRLNLDRRETRLIYVILESNIILACLLDRKRDYKDLEKYLNRL